MKKYLSYLTIATVLFIIAAVLFMKDRKGTLNVSYGSFMVKDTASVTSIRIQKNNTLLILERKKLTWTVNHKYNANPRAIVRLLGIIRNFEIDSPVPRKMKNEILRQIDDSALMVTIGSGGHILKKYRIIDNKAISGGSVVLLDGEKDPYVVNTEGSGGRLSLFFSVNPFMWRDRTLYRYNPDDILMVEIDYPANPKSSFAVSFQGENHTTLRSPATYKTSGLSNKWAMQYLMNFHWVPFHWITPQEVKSVNDSLTGKIPYCEIKIKNYENQVDTVKYFKIPAQGKPGSFNLDKMYAQFQDDSIPVIVKYYDLDPIMKKYGDLVKP